MEKRLIIKKLTSFMTLIPLLIGIGCDEYSLREKNADNMLKQEGLQRNYIFSLDESSFVIIEGYLLRPGGTLYYIVKQNSKWDLVQTIDLSLIMKEYSPLSVTHNNKWICITTVPKFNKMPGKLFVFQKHDKQWQPKSVPDKLGLKDFGKSLALYKENLLIYSEPYTEKTNETGIILCCDLGQNPPVLSQIIQPHQKETRISYGGFGDEFILDGNLLLVKDSGCAYTSKEFDYYGLSRDDLNPTTYNNIKQPVNKKSFPIYRFIGHQWEFETDIFEKLPHPEGEALRKSKKYRSWCGNMYNPLISFSKFYLINDAVYLISDEKIFIIKNENNNWSFVNQIQSELVNKNINVNLITPSKNYFIKTIDKGKYEIYDKQDISIENKISELVVNDDSDQYRNTTFSLPSVTKK
jgi:hypothetical protein